VEAKDATISLATEDDLLTLGQILIEAHGPEVAMAFFFKDWPSSTTMLPIMYLKLGYKDVGLFELDLNNYGEKYPSFGIYQTCAMLRQPRKSLA